MTARAGIPLILLGLLAAASPSAAQPIEGLDERLERLELDERNLADRLTELAALASEKEKDATPLQERQDYTVELIRLHQQLGQLRQRIVALRPYTEPPVFKVTRVDGERRFGSVDRYSDANGDSVLSVVASGLPQELVADQPFTVRFDARRRIVPSAELANRALAAGQTPPGLGELEITVRVGETEITVSRPAADCSTERRADFWASLWIELRFTPDHWALQDDEMLYYYRVDLQSNGVVEQGSASSVTALMRWRPWMVADRRGFYDVTEAVGRPTGIAEFDDRRYLSFHQGVDVSFPGQFLVYAPVAVGETYVSGITTPRHPTDLEMQPDNCRQGGLRYTVVPRLEGLDQRDAVARLREVGLVERLVEAGAAPRPEDRRRVARQDPPAGSRVEAGYGVALHVWGDAEALAAVPDVLDLTFEQARTFLEARGFRALRVAAGAPRSAEDGDRVIRQEPVAGSRQAPGTAVTVLAYDAFEAGAESATGGMVPVGDVTTVGSSSGDGNAPPSGGGSSGTDSAAADTSLIPEWIDLATDAYDHCQFEIAKLYADLIATVDPANAWLRANRQRIETQLRNQQRTLRAMQLAQSLLQQGRTKEAIATLRSASETSPSCMTQVVSTVYGEAQTQLGTASQSAPIDPQVVQGIIDSIIKIRDQVLPAPDQSTPSNGTCPPGYLAISDRQYWQIGQAEVRCVKGPTCPDGYYLYNNQTCVLDE